MDENMQEQEQEQEELVDDLEEYEPKGLFGYISSGTLFLIIVIITVAVLLGGIVISSFMKREMANQPARVEKEIIDMFKK